MVLLPRPLPPLPFAAGDGLAGIGGRLKQTCDDFVVVEVPEARDDHVDITAPGFDAKRDAKHLHVVLTRQGLTTREAQERLAHAMFEIHSNGLQPMEIIGARG